MPISKTVSGLIYFDELDSLSGWTPVPINLGAGDQIVNVDTGNKHSGSGSIKNRVKTHYGGGAGYVEKNINVGYGEGRRVRVWHKTAHGGSQSYRFASVCMNGGWYSGWKFSMPSPWEDGFTHDWQIEKGTLTATGYYATQGVVNVDICLFNNGYPLGAYDDAWCDRLVIAQSDVVTVSSLTPGQKVEIYRASDNTLVASGTCQAGQSTVGLNIDAEDYPEQMYLKVYATDGVTLVETTTAYQMCGGDTWDWTTGAGTLTVETDTVVIYRLQCGDTPNHAHLTAQLKTLQGAPYPGKTVTFSTTLGSVSPDSDTTDSNGEAHTTLTCPTHGFAVAKANWAGDQSVPACSAYCVVHIFYNAEVGDSSKGFQFYVQGIEYSFTAGRYAWNERGELEEFEVELPEWPSTLTVNGLVSIYRKGIKEFSGILKAYERSLSDSPRVVVRGSDISFMLDDTVVPIEIYNAQFPQDIIEDLLTDYPSGITPGVLGLCSIALTMTIDTDTLHEAIKRVCEAVNWHYRVNMDRTLDFSESFAGGMSAAIFEEGVNIIQIERKENYYTVANWIRMKGSGIISTKQDGTKIQQDSTSGRRLSKHDR